MAPPKSSSLDTGVPVVIRSSMSKSLNTEDATMNRTAHSDQHGTRRRAPLHSYAMAIASALVLAGGLGALAAFLREQDGVLTGVGLGIFTFPPLLALSWLVLVSRHTVTPEPHAEESVERQWLDRALSGCFTDVLTACGLALTAVASPASRSAASPL